MLYILFVSGLNPVNAIYVFDNEINRSPRKRNSLSIHVIDTINGILLFTKCTRSLFNFDVYLFTNNNIEQ